MKSKKVLTLFIALVVIGSGILFFFFTSVESFFNPDGIRGAP